MYLSVQWLGNLRAALVQGTVVSLLEDESGHIVGVSYKDKLTATTRVRARVCNNTVMSVHTYIHTYRQ